jgi:hypothetical protein
VSRCRFLLHEFIVVLSRILCATLAHSEFILRRQMLSAPGKPSSLGISLLDTVQGTD